MTAHINPNTFNMGQYRHYLNYLPKGTRTVLDVDFGRGEFMLTLQAKGYAVAGCDIDEGLVRRGREKGLNVELGQAEAVSQVYGSGSFDLMSCLHTLEHLDSPLAALREFRFVARRYVLVAVPNAYARLPEIGSHLYSFNYQTLTNMAKRAGFEPVKVTGETINILPNVVRLAPGVSRLIIGALYGSVEIVALLRRVG